MFSASRRIKIACPEVLNHLRIAQNLTANELTYRVLCLHPEWGYVFRKYQKEHERGLDELAISMAESTAEAMEAVKFIQYLNAMIDNGTATLLPFEDGLGGSVDMRVQERMIGWVEGSVTGSQDLRTLYIQIPLAMNRVHQVWGADSLNRINERQLSSQLVSLGIVGDSKNDKVTVQKRIPSENHARRRVMVITGEKFAGFLSGESLRDFQSIETTEEILKEIGL